MSVISVKHLTSKTRQQDGPKTIHVATYQVVLSGIDPNGSAVAFSATDGTTSIPSYNDSITVEGQLLYVRQKNADPTGERPSKIFLVTVQYEQVKFGDIPIDPLDRPTLYAWEDSTSEEPYFTDTEGKPVTNSVGETFAEKPKRSVSRGTLVVTKNVATYNDLTAESYRNTINSSIQTIKGTAYAVGTLKIAGYSVKGPLVENGTTYYVATIRVAKNMDGWDDRFADRGLNELIDYVDPIDPAHPTTRKLIPIPGADYYPVTKPWPLDGSGSSMPSSTSTPGMLTFKPYFTGAFPDLT